MSTNYIDFIRQTFSFPQKEFKLTEENVLQFHGVDLYELVQKYGTPLKFSYLPKISENIVNAKSWFEKAISKNGYTGKYQYCYCTKKFAF